MLGSLVLLIGGWLVCANGFFDPVENMLQKSVTKFTLDLDKAIDRFRSEEIRKGDTSNIILSPLNLVHTLSVIHLGALGKTFDEISYVLGLRDVRYFQSHSDLVYATFASLIEDVCAHPVNSSKPFINMSTVIFSQTDYPMEPQFKGFLQLVYETVFMELDMTCHPSKATDQINQWLNERMWLGMGWYILPRLISTNADAVIASTLNFIGTRDTVAGISVTQEPFMISSNKFVTVDMVNFSGRGSFYRDEELGVEIIGLPYGPSEINIKNDANVMEPSTSMYILRPIFKDSGFLVRMKSWLTPEIIEDRLGKLKSMDIVYHLPLMNLSSTLNLKRELVSMGLSSLFHPTESNLGLLPDSFQFSSDKPHDFKKFGCDFMKPKRDNVFENPLCRHVGLYELRENLTCPMELKNPGIFMSHFLHKVNMNFEETRTTASSGTSAARLWKPDNESDSSDIHNDTDTDVVSDIYHPVWKDHNVMDVKINWPFSFFIKHHPTNLMLFWGTVHNPTSN